MTLTRTFSAFSRTFGGSVILAAAILAAVLAGPSKANGSDVVLGNLGPSGGLPLGGSSLNFPAGVTQFGIGFSTGSDPLTLDLESAVLGLRATTLTTSATAAIVGVDISGNPDFSNLVGLIESQSVDTTGGKITFTAPSPISLNPTTNYFLAVSSGGQLAWFEPLSSWTAQNSSGWGFNSSVRLEGTNWGPTTTGAGYINAVPEPGTIVLLATAVAAVGGGVLRRRMKAAAKS
jgi:hypothetical protein